MRIFLYLVSLPRVRNKAHKGNLFSSEINDIMLLVTHEAIWSCFTPSVLHAISVHTGPVVDSVFK